MDDDDDDECVLINKRRDAQCGCCDHVNNHEKPPPHDTRVATTYNWLNIDGSTKVNVELSVGNPLTKEPHNSYHVNTTCGVQGGMSLPADEAQSAETPEHIQDVPDPPPTPHPDQRTRRNKRKMLVPNSCQCCHHDTPATYDSDSEDDDGRWLNELLLENGHVPATPAHVPATSAAEPADHEDESERVERTRREEFDRLHPAFDAASAERVSREAQELHDPLMVEKRHAQEAFAEARARAIESFSKRQALDEHDSISLLETSVRDNLIAVASEAKRIRVAMDSAAVANVINPEDLPNDVEFTPNETDDHFVGANDSVIERYGTCATILTGEQGSVGCEWDMANVTRPLHSVAKVAGPKGGPGKQDILFDNDDCYVVAPGVVKAIMKHIAAVAHYERDGNLYLASMTVAPFPRPGHAS